jgi:hypothetical protein
MKSNRGEAQVADKPFDYKEIENARKTEGGSPLPGT